MKTFDVQPIEIKTNFEKAFTYIADPKNLPLWTAAFKEADEGSTLLVTPMGELKIGSTTISNKESGTIDWHMKMPDGNVDNVFVS